MIGKVIYSELINTAAIAAIIDDRVFPSFIPQETPFDTVVYKIENVDPIIHKDGPNALDKVDIQIDIYCISLTNAQTVSLLIRGQLDDFSGTVQGVTVQEMYYTGETNSEFIEEYGMNLISQTYRARVFNT